MRELLLSRGTAREAHAYTGKKEALPRFRVTFLRKWENTGPFRTKTAVCPMNSRKIRTIIRLCLIKGGYYGF